MEKVSASDRSFRKRKSFTAKKKVEKDGVSKVSFTSLLDIGREEPVELDSIDYSKLDLEDLLDEIHESGEALKEVPTLKNVKLYRGAVSRFLKFIVKNSLETETTAGSNFNPLKKQKRYTIIRMVDKKLENLAAGVLQNQSDKLYILERIEEINGLIINLIK